MSLVPRWKSLFPSTSHRPSDLFNLGKFFEDLEHEVESFSSSQSGLSVSSDDKAVYIEAHVPGLTAKEVEVSIDSNNVLWIKGERKEEEKNKKYYRHSQTVFSYCVPLWEDIDTSIEAEALCKNGVMKITLSKRKDKQIEAKKIKVKE